MTTRVLGMEDEVRFVRAPRARDAQLVVYRRGVYGSEDVGVQWEQMKIPWDARCGAQRTEGLVVS